MQFVRAYSPLEAGVRLIPIALRVMLGAGRSHLLVGRSAATGSSPGHAARRRRAGELVGLGGRHPYWVVGVSLFLALGLGNVMAPATDAVMEAVPEANAGVGSAMNDVTRQVAGAFGVAIIGSLINTVYADRMTDATAALPPAAADLARTWSAPPSPSPPASAARRPS